MGIKLLALDLDGTLLNEEFKISKRNRRAINKAVQEGVKVTFATGRMFRSALPYIIELGLDLPVITYHGALIITAQEKRQIIHYPVPLDLAIQILKLSEQENFHVNLYINDSLFVSRENEYSRYYQTIAPVEAAPVEKLSAFLEEQNLPPTKLTIIDWVNLQKIQSALEEKFGAELTILQSRPYFLEITHHLATKGQALKYLAERKGIKYSETAAIGDSYNDLDMIKTAGIGVAVANAREEVRKAADVVTLSNVEDGVAFFIERYILDNCKE